MPVSALQQYLDQNTSSIMTQQAFFGLMRENRQIPRQTGMGQGSLDNRPERSRQTRLRQGPEAGVVVPVTNNRRPPSQIYLQGPDRAVTEMAIHHRVQSAKGRRQRSKPRKPGAPLGPEGRKPMDKSSGILNRGHPGEVSDLPKSPTGGN